MNLNQRDDKNQKRTKKLEGFLIKNLVLSNKERDLLSNLMKAFAFYDKALSPLYENDEYNKDISTIRFFLPQILSQLKIESNEKNKLRNFIDSIKDSNDIYLCYQKIREHIIE